MKPETPKQDVAPKPLVLNPLGGPEPPDMNALVEAGRKRHDAELAAAEQLTRDARAGSAPAYPAAKPAAAPSVGQTRVDFDWRGETAFFVEHDRLVRLACIYWGGSAGHIAHTTGHWEYHDGRREPLTNDERETVLRLVIERAREGHNVTLETQHG